MASKSTSQTSKTDGSTEAADPVLALSAPTPAPSPLNPSFQKQGTSPPTTSSKLIRHKTNKRAKGHQSLAARRAHRPEAITIPPASPSPSELSTIKLEDLASLSRASSELPLRAQGPNTKSPRVLMNTNTFRWVKMKDGVWVKVKRYRFIIIRK
ncbi:hypothetical protein CkaCkLH20_02741 [Colletotrichum karsti]|uniref:Uncharacterized protein n=1 Tax=Colletotrichum karsti TaxID=1095194 RepID=A0A9P6LNR5_9PEZI|nr:uncharacterized protein CkaCkLH20_02741 [Colletotrichum karsti]KAF9879930.1 hypothetical protein CkaCkLH20_02741 [Colletotrichum karsti]